MERTTPKTSTHLDSITEMLYHAGIRFHNRHADCPECHSHNSVSLDIEKGLYNCHHAGCDFHGNARQLAKYLGLPVDHQTCADYRKIREARELAEKADRKTYARRQSLYKLHQRLLSTAYYAMATRDPDGTINPGPHAWWALGAVHQRLPRVRAEILVLEHGSPQQKLFMMTSKNRDLALDKIIEKGGLRTPDNKFIPLQHGLDRAIER